MLFISSCRYIIKHTPIAVRSSRKIINMAEKSSHGHTFCNSSKSIDTDQINLDDEAENSILIPPCDVREMKILQRELFKKTVNIPVISIPAEKICQAVKALKKYFLKVPKLQPVSDSPEGKTILLNPDSINTTDFQNVINTLEVSLHHKEIMLNYENYTKNAVLKAILPENLRFNVTSYSIVGHIIHLNVKEQINDYKTIIAQVLLDKIPTAKTIINKAKVIDSTFRNFEMELLSGEPKYEVSVKENGFKYEFDFSKVFWNPRLSNEHQEIAKKFEAGDIVFDVFAGVGPFAVPAAKKECEVHANDLNPDSYKWLCHNASINKVSHNLHCYNMDGSEFILSVVKKKLIELYSQKSEKSVHVLMNLPASALEFVSWFKALILSDTYVENIKLPIIYCYFFDKKDDFEEKLIYKYLHEDVRQCINETVLVRNVAPNKTMVRLVFHIPRTYLFGNCDFKESDTECGSKKKKQKLSHLKR